MQTVKTPFNFALKSGVLLLGPFPPEFTEGRPNLRHKFTKVSYTSPADFRLWAIYSLSMLLSMAACCAAKPLSRDV